MSTQRQSNFTLTRRQQHRYSEERLRHWQPVNAKSLARLLRIAYTTAMRSLILTQQPIYQTPWLTLVALAKLAWVCEPSREQYERQNTPPSLPLTRRHYWTKIDDTPWVSQYIWWLLMSWHLFDPGHQQLSSWCKLSSKGAWFSYELQWLDIEVTWYRDGAPRKPR